MKQLIKALEVGVDFIIRYCLPYRLRCAMFWREYAAAKDRMGIRADTIDDLLAYRDFLLDYFRLCGGERMKAHYLVSIVFYLVVAALVLAVFRVAIG